MNSGMNSVDEPKQRLINWRLAQSAAERYWLRHQQVEKATESVLTCTWTKFWTLVVSFYEAEKLSANKVESTMFILKKMFLYR